MSDQLLTALTVAGAVGSGLVGGVMLAFSTFVMGGLRELPAPQGIRAMQRINAAAPRPVFMFAFIGTGILCLVLIVQALTDPGRTGAALRLIGGGCYLLAIAITGGFHIPRNNALDSVDPDAPDAAGLWRRYLREWLPGNHLRVLTAGAGTTLLSLSLQGG